jgi:DNA-binding NarL/FixJ family response regulator
MIKLALVDDHAILRKSLAIVINLLHGFETIFQASNGQDFINQLCKKPLPDIVLMDITMPVMDGVETTRWLKQHHPGIKVIVLSMLKNELVLIRMLRNGARGYLLKDADPEELHKALWQVYEKGYYHNELFTPLMQVQTDLEKEPTGIMLNEKELSFLRWACTEKSHKQIAAEMCVSPRTIDGYRDTLFRKLSVVSRVGLVMYALRNEIVHL